MKTKKKAGRRLKKDWRTKIDVTDVDTYLDEKRLKERIGYVIYYIKIIIYNLSIIFCYSILQRSIQRQKR